MAGTRITFSDTSLGYPGMREPVLRLSLDIQPGEFVVVIGPNGCGKTTILTAIQGLLRPTAGTITLDGPHGRWVQGAGTGRPARSPGVAHIHQDPGRGTVADLTVMENLRLASIRGIPRTLNRPDSRADIDRWAAQAAAVGLEDSLGKPVRNLSQGQRHLLALQLALTQNASVLLADEHTSSLDLANADKCLETTSRLCAEQGVTVIMVTHEIQHALRHGSRLILLRNGAVAADISGERKAALGAAELFELCGYNSRR